MQEKRMLITGFDPFNGNIINPAWLAVEALPEQIGEYFLTKLQLPTVYGTAAEIALAAAKELDPDVILCIGMAAGRASITPERVAINLRDSMGKDNDGQIFSDASIIPDGPVGIFTTLPVKDMVTAVKENGLPASISYSAGTFVCNDLMYSILYHYRNTSTKVGFIHVPKTPEMGEGAAMLLEDIVKGLSAAIAAI